MACAQRISPKRGEINETYLKQIHEFVSLFG